MHTQESRPSNVTECVYMWLIIMHIVYVYVYAFLFLHESGGGGPSLRRYPDMMLPTVEVLGSLALQRSLCNDWLHGLLQALRITSIPFMDPNQINFLLCQFYHIPRVYKEVLPGHQNPKGTEHFCSGRNLKESLKIKQWEWIFSSAKLLVSWNFFYDPPKILLFLLLLHLSYKLLTD